MHAALPGALWPHCYKEKDISPNCFDLHLNRGKKVKLCSRGEKTGMEDYIYGIAVGIILFKFLLWMCICVIRSNRREHQRTTRRYILAVPGRGQILRVPNTRQAQDNDRASIVKNEEIPQAYPPGMPPPYTYADLPNLNSGQPSRVV
ncbi:uncharacterized protein LOC134239061 isoform X2 [Saccostrea cucullata]|uniref:uncharacterized protein LOC134239061 isoform X2 n=1 Tax=Saccostrea cuccullata TaxID=36930 RepID=UPI002ED63608